MKVSSGPAENTILELAEHYFDCTSFNEADKYINIKEQIIQYLGIKYGGDVRTTLGKMTIYQIPVPKDRVKEGNNVHDTKTDKEGTTIITKKTRDKISYSEKTIFDRKIIDRVDKKKKLA